jgi:hypothetical protein
MVQIIQTLLVSEEHREGLHIFVVFMFGFMNKEIFFKPGSHAKISCWPQLQVCEINLSHLQSKDTSRVDSELAQQNANSFFRFFRRRTLLPPIFLS